MDTIFPENALLLDQNIQAPISILSCCIYPIPPLQGETDNAGGLLCPLASRTPPFPSAAGHSFAGLLASHGIWRSNRGTSEGGGKACDVSQTPSCAASRTTSYCIFQSGTSGTMSN